jgi:hypothetical protein
MSFVKSFSALWIFGAVAIALPGAALAAAPRGENVVQAVEGKHEKSFPIDGAKFKAHVDKRIEKMKQKVTAKLDEKKVSAEQRKTVLAALDAGAKKIRDAANRVAADGKVTKEEAAEVREISKTVRKEAGFGKKKKANA